MQGVAVMWSELNERMYNACAASSVSNFLMQ